LYDELDRNGRKGERNIPRTCLNIVGDGKCVMELLVDHLQGKDGPEKCQKCRALRQKRINILIIGIARPG
jgi:hypothetical protein